MQQENKGLFELAVDDAILGDDQSGEDGLVEPAPEFWASRAIGPAVAVAQKSQAGGQIGLDGTEGQSASGGPGLGPGDVATQALLLAAEQFEWDGVGVVGSQELVLLFPQHLQVPGGLSPVSLDLLMSSGQLGAARFTEGVEVLQGELDALPVVLDQLFDGDPYHGLSPTTPSWARPFKIGMVIVSTAPVSSSVGWRTTRWSHISLTERGSPASSLPPPTPGA